MKSYVLAVFALIYSAHSFAEEPAVLSKPEGPDQHGAITRPRVFFIEPKDGATVPRKFTAKFGVQGMSVHPAGEMVPGTGHHHLIIDADAHPEGTSIPADEKHIHFGKGQTETVVSLTPGKHKLTLQFADGAHMPYGPSMASTITVNVK